MLPRISINELKSLNENKFEMIYFYAFAYPSVNVNSDNGG